MMPKRIELILKWVVLLGLVFISCGSAGAATTICAYADSNASVSTDGTGGTGTGGTGAVAEDSGSGTGGTGITLGVYMTESRLAGNVSVAEGIVEARSNGRSRTLAKGDPVCVGETIITSQSGLVQIRMADDSSLSLRPQTQLKIEKFFYSGTNKDKSVLSLLNGSCHVVTGKIAKQYPQNDLIKTPGATIGVHGADHEAIVILPGDGGRYAPGTYDKVNNGETFIRTDKGGVDIHPNQVGFSAPTGELPILLKEPPGFYK